ncbi:hypothetical protein L596_001623 [Steinernema carpocapsae]|uniref:Uncharacterized protein n=1 Tax=Steinernema carpocapsae TaxID=34508 RepID=A0A4U8UNT3_STECR|nr:hypothetical protein L596_001623 [Steinernema carpocapsae]
MNFHFILRLYFGSHTSEITNCKYEAGGVGRILYLATKMTDDTRRTRTLFGITLKTSGFTYTYNIVFN